MRERLHRARRWVVKVGSSLITAEGRGLDLELIDAWTRQIAALTQDEREVILVSSGSVAEGMLRLGWTRRPTVIAELQAAAAVGQMGLVQAYESGFKRFGLSTALVLLTHEDVANRQRYLNARATLRSLLAHGVVPVVNENDTVTTGDSRLGDNDTLAALVADLVEAEVLVLLTDQAGLYDADPRTRPDAQLLERADASDPAIRALAGPSVSGIGSGGMSTKVRAAERAARVGTSTVIASGREPEVLPRLAAGDAIGTLLTSDQRPRDARKRWLANQLRARGSLHVDAGAARVLRETGSSLLAVGVTRCEGDFLRGELVRIVDPLQVEIGRGLVNYSAVETRRIVGLPTRHIEERLGYRREEELVHRDNMVVSA